MGVFRSDEGLAKGRGAGFARPDFIVSMSPPGCPSARSRPRGAGFRFTRQLQLSRNAAVWEPVCSVGWRAIMGAEWALSPSLRQFPVSFGGDLLLAPFPLGQQVHIRARKELSAAIVEGLKQQSQSHPEKILRIPRCSAYRSSSVSSTWEAASAAAHPQILRTRLPVRETP